MKKILVADDVRTIRNLLVATLKNDEYKIFEAENGMQAVEIAGKERPDLIILDIMMPELDGFGVTEKLKSEFLTKNCYIMIVSAKKNDADITRAKRVGADDYLTKPFSPTEMIEKVRNVLCS